MNRIPTDPVGRDEVPNRLCYHYISVGLADAYTTISGWYCNGNPYTDYEYVLSFSTEVSDAPYARVTNLTGEPNNEYAYCIPGPLR